MALEEILTTVGDLYYNFPEAPAYVVESINSIINPCVDVKESINFVIAKPYFKEFINSMITAPITITGAEITSQVMANLKIEKKEYHIKKFNFKLPNKILKEKKWKDFKFDWNKIGYAAKVSPLLGFGIYGTTRTRMIPESLGVDNPLVQAALGPNLVGIGYNAFWYSVMNVGEKCEYSLKEVTKYMLDKKNNFIGTVSKDGFYFAATLTLTLWNAVAGTTFAYANEIYHTPIFLITSLFTTTAMALTLKDDYIKGYGDKAEKVLEFIPKKIAQGYNASISYIKRK